MIIKTMIALYIKKKSNYKINEKGYKRERIKLNQIEHNVQANVHFLVLLVTIQQRC